MVIGQMTDKVDRELATEHKIEALKAEIKIKGLTKEEIEKTIDRITRLARRKNLHNESKIIQDMCPICGNLMKYDSNLIMQGVHNSCFAMYAGV